MEYLSKDSPRNDDELLQWYIDAGKRAVVYGREHQLFDIPQDYRLDVTPTPPVLRSTIDAAYYPAPPFKKTGVGRFYLTPTGNDPAALKLNNRASVADTRACQLSMPGTAFSSVREPRRAEQCPLVHAGGGRDSPRCGSTPSQPKDGIVQRGVDGRAGGRTTHGFYTAAEHLYELQGQLLARCGPGGHRPAHRPHVLRRCRGLLHRARIVLSEGGSCGGAMRRRKPSLRERHGPSTATPWPPRPSPTTWERMRSRVA